MQKLPLKKYAIAFLPSVLWAGLIFFFSAQQMLPSLHLSVLDFLFKKTAHMFVYAVLYYLLYKGLTKVEISIEKRWWLAFLICLCYALTDEFHQSMVPGRSATFRDIGFDMLGASLVVLRQKKYI